MSQTVELDEKTAAVVRELASNEKRTASEVIHDALAVYARIVKRPLSKGEQLAVPDLLKAEFEAWEAASDDDFEAFEKSLG